MGKLSLLIVLLTLISGCNLLSDDNNSIDNTAPFTWSEIVSFHNDTIRAVQTHSDGGLFVAGNNHLYISEDTGKTFIKHNIPDSTNFIHIEKFDNRFYAIGDVEVETMFWSSPLTVTKQVIYISDNGHDWEMLKGPSIIRDIAFDNNGYMYIAKTHGASAFDLSSRTEYPVNFYDDDWGGAMDEIVTNSKGEVFSGSHGGIYKSSDRGKSWNHTSGDIGRLDGDIASVNFLEITQDDQIIATSGSRMYQSIDGGTSWSKEDIMTYNEKLDRKWTKYLTHLDIMKNGYLYTTDSNGVLVAHPNSKTDFYYAGPERYNNDLQFIYNNIVTFENGDVLTYSSKTIFLGKKNSESSFWTDILPQE